MVEITENDNIKLIISNNKKNKYVIEINDKKYSVNEIAKMANKTAAAVYAAINHNDILRLFKSKRPMYNIKSEKYDVGHDKMMTAREISEYTGFSRSFIYKQIANGIRGEKLLEKKQKQLFFYDTQHDVGNDKMMSVKEIADYVGISINEVKRRIRCGYKKEELLLPKNNHRNKSFQNAKYDVGNGQMMTVKEIADYTRISIKGIRSRIKNNYKGKDLLLIKGENRCAKVSKNIKYDIGNSKTMTTKEFSQYTGIPLSSILSRIYRGKDLKTQYKEFLYEEFVKNFIN